jgi:hypothetical protein
MTTTRYLSTVAYAALLTALSMVPFARAEQDEPDEKAERPAASAKEIADWIAQLDDNRYLVREQATQKLLKANSAALDPLLAAANGARPEPADRAVWILRRIARSRDNDEAIAALERIVQLRDRPLLVEKAGLELDERNIAAFQARLSPLGAEVVYEPAAFDNFTVAPVLWIRLGEKWRGTTEDLKDLGTLRQQLYFRLEGRAITNDVAKLFETKEKLSVVQFFNTSVTPAAVDAIKAKHPDAMVYVRGQALLGVSADNHPAGVMVRDVQAGSAASNAGIIPGDVIASLGGQTIPDFDRLTARIAQHQPGETVEVEVIRGNERKKLPVTFGSWATQE